jgi:RNA polymerase sigma-70 factor (ECF subfamily)
MAWTIGDLYLRCHSRVVQVALALLADPDEAEDIAQEVFVEAWQRRASYDPARGSEWTWLRTIARSRSLDRLRAGHRRREIFLEARPVTAQAPEGNAEDVDVRSLLARLSARERAILKLAFLDGLTHRDIANRTGQPLGTVKTRIRSALARLAKLVEPALPIGVSPVEGSRGS